MTKRISISEFQKMCGGKSSRTKKKQPAKPYELKPREYDYLKSLDYSKGIEFVGHIPSKKNSRITVKKTGRSFPQKRYTQWHEAMSKQLNLMVSRGIDIEIKESGKFPLTIFFPTKGIADLTNKAESVMDFFVDNKIITDDNWIVTGRVILDPVYRKGIGGFKIGVNNEKEI